MDRTRRRQGRVEYRQPNGSWSTKPPKGGAIVKAPSSAVTKPSTKPSAKPSAKPTAGSRPALPPGRSVPGGRRGGVGAALLGIQLGQALAPAIARPFKEAIRTERGQRAAESAQYGRYAAPSSQVRSTPAASKPKPKPSQPPAAAPARPSRSSSGTSTSASSQRPAASPAKPKQETKAAAQSYRDPEDVKGTSVGRYRTLSEHRAAVQANKALKISSQADTKSDVYTPSTKVDGSKLDASKATSKAEEYDKNKRKKIR